MKQKPQSIKVKSAIREAAGNSHLACYTKKDAIDKGIKAFLATPV